jgi:hypothetical protein
MIQYKKKLKTLSKKRTLNIKEKRGTKLISPTLHPINLILSPEKRITVITGTKEIRKITERLILNNILLPFQIIRCFGFSKCTGILNLFGEAMGLKTNLQKSNVLPIICGLHKKNPFFVWLVAHNRCWTVDRLAGRGLPHPEHCPLYDQAKTIDHLLVRCVFAREFWFHFFSRIGLQAFPRNPQKHPSIFGARK